MIFKRYSYEEFHRDTETLAGLIQEFEKVRGRTFTKIYGIPRGGLMVAVRLSHLLRLPLVLHEEEIDENTIVADDIVSTGATCKKLEERIHARHFLVASIFLVRDFQFSRWDRNVFTSLLDDNRNVWIVFPWETEQSMLS
jgi:hypothetical protein